ncbi:lysoplasmalogenase [Rhodalgimonas zhirmunskyi]|uniref:Lysoplasmalogenase n=1 Tax=Rhodalgimonas zhirmunskyi TaxID=2964767 RepID=A0AAJ1U861_9RHOB|nr:lysoplasmalogenase [Rhodoalgimonas zhirmunskyi]MDQ2093525.1 lysoplasmalogenase [Rhodoalgimonas zhirmunskyi]
MEITTLMMIAAGLATSYWIAHCYRRPSLKKSVIKTLSVVLLLAAAALGHGPVLLIVALALCALGDYLLSRAGDGAFMAGVGAFAAGHLAYIALFLTTPGADLGRIPAAWPILAGLAVLGIVMAVLLWPRTGALRGPVMAYIPIILGMGVSAQALPLAVQDARLAAFLFIASDLILALEMFVLREGPAKRLAPFAIWPLYWLAQALFTLAFIG